MSDWAGRWRVTSTVPGGGTYDGFIDIAPLGDGWRLDWMISAGAYAGVGLAAGDELFVSCGESLDRLGLVVADLDAGAGRMCGPDGVTSAVSVAADGAGWLLSGGFEASVALRPNGESLLADLDVGDGILPALAWRSGSVLALAWGPSFDQQVILAYRMEGDGRASAVWALADNPQRAHETLFRVA